MDILKLTVMSEYESIPVVQGVVGHYAKRYGMSEDEVIRLSIAIEETMVYVIEKGFPGRSDGSIDIEVKVKGLKFIVFVSDKGIPFTYDSLENNERAHISFELLRRYTDRVTLNNLGAGGRRQVLTKNLSKMPVYARTVENTDEVLADVTPEELQYHSLSSKEAVEVAQCIYDEFGYTYAHEVVYHPEKFFNSVVNGECLSLVASAPDGEVAGHLALVGTPALRGTMEMCMGVVKKRFRKCSIMGNLTVMMMGLAKDMGLTSINAMPVTYHVYTQKICNKQGMSPCGFLFNLIAEDLATSYDQGFRTTLALAVTVLKDRHRVVHVRERYRGIVEYVVDNASLDRDVVVEDADLQAYGDSIVSVKFYARMESGRIIVDNIGSDIEERLRNSDRYMRSQKCKMTQLMISTELPGSAVAQDIAASMGYFCTGFFPGCEDVDYLIMQRITYSTVDYDRLQTVEPFTGLLELIRAGDSSE